MIHGLKVILECLAADSNAVFDDFCCFAEGECISFDRV
jgi:hypothetical protein